ncbi:MAG: diacylglycerol kinase [Magnetospirillum sp.]|nr:diacylglycerol kinase [Magnetospirillum sp.]
MKGGAFFRRAAFAAHGLVVALRREKSFRLQAAAAVAVFIVLAVMRPPALWWAIGTLASGTVLAAELINTALEILADRLHPDLHPEIRAAKDVAAAAVLVASFTALAVAVAFLFRYA